MKDKEIEKKLSMLLDYWIEHNREHSQEFREWAEKAEASGEPDVSRVIRQAADEMDAATEHLAQAKKQLAVEET
ncbi:hypothetical protein ACFLWN_02685 [Chloroflexota bacterium]